MNMLILALLGATALLTLAHAKELARKKPFGLQLGPTYIGGSFNLSDVGEDSTRERSRNNFLIGRIYRQYRNYRKLSGQMIADEIWYHEVWSDRGLCEQGCNEGADCVDGLCMCQDGYLQIYGQCNSVHPLNLTFARSSERKYRKPPDPPRPETCFEIIYKRRTDGKGWMALEQVKASMLNEPQCILPPFIKRFDPSEQNCTYGQPCNVDGVNLMCNEVQDRCTCRPGTQWNEKTMECQVFLDVNCVQYAPNDPILINMEVMELLTKSPGEVTPDPGYSKEEINRAFCHLLESEAQEILEPTEDGSDEINEIHSTQIKPTPSININTFPPDATLLDILSHESWSDEDSMDDRLAMYYSMQDKHLMELLSGTPSSVDSTVSPDKDEIQEKPNILRPEDSMDIFVSKNLDTEITEAAEAGRPFDIHVPPALWQDKQYTDDEWLELKSTVSAYLRGMRAAIDANIAVVHLFKKMTSPIIKSEFELRKRQMHLHDVLEILMDVADFPLDRLELLVNKKTRNKEESKSQDQSTDTFDGYEISASPQFVRPF